MYAKAGPPIITSIEPQAFLSIDEDAPLGICVFNDGGAHLIGLEEFIHESLIDLSPILRQRYACAFEVMAKQLRGQI